MADPSPTALEQARELLNKVNLWPVVGGSFSNETLCDMIARALDEAERRGRKAYSDELIATQAEQNPHTEPKETRKRIDGFRALTPEHQGKKP